MHILLFSAGTKKNCSEQQQQQQKDCSFASSPVGRSIRSKWVGCNHTKGTFGTFTSNRHRGDTATTNTRWLCVMQNKHVPWSSPLCKGTFSPSLSPTACRRDVSMTLLPVYDCQRYNRTLINTDNSLLSTTIHWSTQTIPCYQRYNHTLINTDYSLLSTIQPFTDQHWLFSVINDTTIHWSTLTILCYQRYNHTLINTGYSMLRTTRLYTDQHWAFRVINDTTIHWSTLNIVCVRLSTIQPYTDQRWLHQVNDCQQTIQSHTSPWTMTSP